MGKKKKIQTKLIYKAEPSNQAYLFQALSLILSKEDLANKHLEKSKKVATTKNKRINKTIKRYG